MISPRKADKPLVLYGYGKLGHLAEEIFNELKIPIAAIIDKTYRYKTVEELYQKDSLLAVCVASEPYTPICNGLKSQGWTDLVPVWDIIEAYPEVGIHNGWFITKEAEDNWIPPSWDDKVSSQHYWAMCTWRKFREESPIPVEPTESLPSTLIDIRKRQQVVIYDDAPMETINVHAEGSELLMLQANLRLFKKHRPKIEVACYHSRDGLWKIPKMLMDSLPDYQWTFRLTAYMGQGAYIYGMPKEKI